MNNNDLLDPQSIIHKAAYEQVTKIWPIIIQLVRVRPELANSMRSALPPALLAMPAPAPAPKGPRIDQVLSLIKTLGLSLPGFLKLLLSVSPDGRTRSHMHATTVAKFLGGGTAIPADEIVGLMFNHRDSAPRATRGDSKAAMRKKDASRMARARILHWAERVVRIEVKREMGVLVAPKTSVLRPGKGFGWTSLNSTSMTFFNDAITTSAPMLHRLMLAAATTTKKEKEMEGSGMVRAVEGRGKAKRDPGLVVTCSILMLAVSRAVRANLFQRLIGAWLWSICAPASLYSVLSRAGFSVTYPTVLRFLRELARNDMLELHSLLSVCLWIVIYDNINRRHRIWQEKLGQTWEQLNGTAPTVILSPTGAGKSIFNPEPVLRARAEKRRLAFTADTLREAIDYPHQRSVMANHCLRFLFSWVGGQACVKYEARVLETFRTTLAKRRIPPGRKSRIFPLGTSAFNEATVRGTKDVLDDIFLRQLGLTAEDLVKELRLVGGDQLTVARLRSLQAYMASCPHGHSAVKWVFPLVLVWHMGWADLARIIQTHYGRGAGGDPSALHHVNVLLKRRVKDEDRPDFYPALRLVSETLKADVLDCWKLVLGTDNLKTYFAEQTVEFEELEKRAYELVDQYLSLSAAECAEKGSGARLDKFLAGSAWVRPNQEAAASSATRIASDAALTDLSNTPANFDGDQSLANAIRRRHDSVLQYEFQFAIADGDFGRAWEVIMVWASTFAGSGHLKYMDEVLELFCSFKYELPEDLTNFIWDCSTASFTGNDGSYVPLDLIQEWMIGEIKGHMARSDEAFDSSFVREVVAPNVRGGLECKKTIRAMFGLAQAATHRKASLDDECVARLLRDLRTTEANKFRRGRHYGHVANDDDAAGYNVLAGGKVRSFLTRTTSDVCASAEAPDAGTDAGALPADDGHAVPDISLLMDGVLNAGVVEDDDIWDGWDD